MTARIITPLRLMLTCFGLASALSGCGVADVVGLSGAGSMRIEVEVYKGPLSKELSVQHAELKAKIFDATEALEIMRHRTVTAQCRLGCFDRVEHLPDGYLIDDGITSGGTYLGYTKLSEGLIIDDKTYNRFRHDAHSEICRVSNYDVPIKKEIEDNRFDDCLILNNMRVDLVQLQSYSKDKLVKTEPSTGLTLGLQDMSGQELFDNASEFAERLRSRAAYWATEHIATSPEEKRVRIEMANFAQFATEYGNQIGSRTDALVKQIQGVGHNHAISGSGTKILQEQLTASAFLRDSGTTGYLNLYDWNNAAVDRPGSTQTDQVRLVEHLITDTYWSKINTVFAAGQGTVRMVFIKDDIGNWNLKNYDNQPGKLLNAYKSAGLAAVGAVANLAKGSSGVGAASALMGAANQLAFGEREPVEVKQTVDGLHERSTELLNSLGETQQQRYDELMTQVATKKQAIDAAQLVLTNATSRQDAQTRARDAKELALGDAEAALLLIEGRKVALQALRSDETDPARSQSLDDQIGQLDIEIATGTADVTLRQADLTLAEADLARELLAVDQAQATLDPLSAKHASLLMAQAKLGQETVAMARNILQTHGALIDQLQMTPITSAEQGPSALEIVTRAAP